MDSVTLSDLIPSAAMLVIGVISIWVNVLVVKRQINASVLSVNRQAWTNEFRDLVSKYLSLHHNIALFKHELESNQRQGLSDEYLIELLRIRMKIELMMDPKESYAKRLIALLNELNRIAETDIFSNPESLKEYQKCEKKLLEEAKPIIMKQWQRVKNIE